MLQIKILNPAGGMTIFSKCILEDSVGRRIAMGGRSIQEYLQGVWHKKLGDISHNLRVLQFRINMNMFYLINLMCV